MHRCNKMWQRKCASCVHLHSNRGAWFTCHSCRSSLSAVTVLNVCIQIEAALWTWPMLWSLSVTIPYQCCILFLVFLWINCIHFGAVNNNHSATPQLVTTVCFSHARNSSEIHQNLPNLPSSAHFWLSWLPSIYKCIHQSLSGMMLGTIRWTSGHGSPTSKIGWH